MKIKAIALLAVTCSFALVPSSAFARIYRVCDIHECCFIDGGGNGYCVDRNLQV